MKGRLLLDVVITQGTAILQLLAGEDESLLVGRDAFLVLNLLLHVFNRISGVNLKGDGLAGKGLDENLHSTTQTQHQVKGRLLLDVIVTQGTAILELLASEDETLLVGRDTFFVLDLLFHVFDRISGVNLKGDGLAGKGLDENLHSTTQTQHQVKGRLLLDVVVAQGTAILELLASKDETLLVGRDTFFVLDLLFHVFDRISGVNLKGDGLAGKGLDENLHSTTQTQHQVKGRLLLDVVVTQGAAILQLLAGEDETLLVGRDAFLVLNLLLHVFNRVSGVNLKGDCLASEGFHENLHSTTQTQHQVKSRLLLDVVIAQGTAILELLAGEDKTLLVGRDAFLVLDFLLHVFDRVSGVDLKGDGLAGKGLDENLHSTAKTKNKVKGRFLLDVVVA